MSDDKILEIFQLLQAKNFTLRTFLLAAFQSDNESVKRRCSMFAARDGARTVCATWLRHRDQRMKAQLIDEMLAPLAQQVKDELEVLAGRVELRTSSSEVTDGIYLHNGNLLDVHAEVAPVFSRLMSTISNEKKLVQATVQSALLFAASRRTNRFQQAMGIYLYANGAGRKVTDLLNHAGISVSYKTVQRSVDAIGKNALARAASAASQDPFALVYDNINIAARKRNQRVMNKETFDSGSAACLIMLKDVSAESLQAERLAEHVQRPPRTLQFQQLLPSDNDIHKIESCFKHHIIKVLVERCEFLNEFRSQVPQPPQICCLPVQKTEIYSLASSMVDQSTVDGNVRILEDHIAQLRLSEADVSKLLIPVAGDQLTVARLRSIKRLRWDDLDAYKRFEWAVPVIQLFHLKMTIVRAIMKNHYHDSHTAGSIAQHVAILQRKHVQTSFYAADEMIRDSLHARILDCWCVLLNVNDLEELNNGRFDFRTITSKADQFITQFVATDTPRTGRNLNACLFIRDGLLYIELCAAIKRGDTGRILLALKFWTLMLQVKGTKNYATELLHLHCLVNGDYPDATRDAILRSWLVNPNGWFDGFVETDLFQEHVNKWIKCVYSVDGSNGSWDILRKTISPSILTFRRHANVMEEDFAVPSSGIKHSVVGAGQDIKLLMESIRDRCLHKATSQQEVESFKGTHDLFKLGVATSNSEWNRLRAFRENDEMESEAEMNTVPEGNDDDEEWDMEAFVDSVLF